MVDLQPGQLIKEEGGFFLGNHYSPERPDGNISTEEYDIIVAPEDLQQDGTIIFSFNEATEYVGTLNKWHGYDGTKFGNTDPATALKEIRLHGEIYNGLWTLPNKDIADKIRVFCRNNPESALARSFRKANEARKEYNQSNPDSPSAPISQKSDEQSFYWTCERWKNRFHKNYIHTVNFETGRGENVNTDWDDEKHPIRLVRLVRRDI